MNIIYDKETILTSVNQEGWILQFVSDDLKIDKNVVLAAVNNNGRALEYASEYLKMITK